MEQNIQKKLLVLAGACVHSKVVEAANEMGIYTIVTDNLPDSPAKKISNECLMFDIFDVENIIQYCQQHNVNGIINFCIDPAQIPAQYIAEQLSLPKFGTKEQVHILTNKLAFKKKCKECNVDVIEEYNEKDILSNSIKYPVLVKPVDSRGSRGITICYSEDELIKAIPNAKRESSNGDIIIERYMNNNQDLTISYLVKDGEPILVSIGDRHPGSIKDNLDRQLSCTIQPSRYTDMYIKNVNKRVINMIKSIGIQNGPVFMQGFVDGHTVRMYDPGIRFPGNEYERIFTAATNMNLMKSVISFIIGDSIIDYNNQLHGSYNLNNKIAIQYMINVGAGTISVFDGLDIIAQHKNVIDIQQRYTVGDTIYSTGDIRHRAGEISILIERDINKITSLINYIQSTLRILDEHGNNQIISPISIDYIKSIYTF